MLGADGRRSSEPDDVFDELDQFVDADPVGWAAPRTKARDPEHDYDDAPEDERPEDVTDDSPLYDEALERDERAPAYAAYDEDEPPFETEDETFADASDEDVDDTLAAAFSSSHGKSARRDAFARRLNEELSRPAVAAEPEPEPEAEPEPVIVPPAPRAIAPPVLAEPEDDDDDSDETFEDEILAAIPARVIPRAEIAPRPEATPPVREARPVEAPATRPLPPRAPAARPVTTPTSRFAPEEQPGPKRAQPEAVPAPIRPRERAAESAAADEAEAVQLPALPDTGPADALDWELDNAISAIVANGRAKTAPAAPTPDLDEDELLPPVPKAAPYVPVTTARTAPAPAQPQLPARQPAPAPVPAPAAPSAKAARADDGAKAVPAPPAALPPLASPGGLGAKRLRPIPTFRFERREEVNEPFPTAPPDMDDPLVGVFFPEELERRGEGDAFEDDEELDVTLGEYDEDEDDDYRDPRAYDELPPSLSRAAQTGRRDRRNSRFLGFAAMGGGVMILALGGYLAYGLFFGGPTVPTGEPRVIQADARNVKIRAEETESDARPDIAERTALGDNDRLVMPDRVRIDNAAADEDDDDTDGNGLTSRQVRTVVVRPDGTFVSADQMGSGGQAARTASSAQQARNPADAATVGVAPEAEPGVRDVPSQLAANSSTNAASSIGAAPSAGVSPGSTLESLLPSSGEGEAVGLDGTEPGLDAAEATPETGTAVQIPQRRPPPPPRSTSVASVSTQRSEPAPSPSAYAETAPERPTRVTAIDNNIVRPGSSQPSPQAATVSAAPLASAPWGVQVSSQRSRPDAEASFRALQARYPSLLGGVEPLILQADVGERGLFYRVRIAAQSRNEANSLCQRLKSAGADCFVGRN
ncbi:SPOR domain-containing protein [Acuticoccus kandeliae]|uniref:SPOR domain-containing protein n=1 Tax=Acuticoccus kandeliae TaxID=2073160 RepID=UPI0013003B93|nr:SPOR domain-containing protein [Acuticoccus kandeliae]